MPAILLAILKMLGTAAMTGAKAVGKGATAVGKWGLNRMQQGAGLGKLTEAFASDKGGNTPQMLAGTAFDPKKYGIEQTPNVDLGRIRVPGPMGQSIQGQGEAMPGYGMTSNRIPPAYLQMGQQQGGQQNPDVGFIRGMINSLTGQPQPEGLQDVSQGRKTAYYAGGVVPNIVMSKLGQPSSAEATSQQAQIVNTKLTTRDKQQQISLQSDLSKATVLMPKLSPEQKDSLFNELVAKYPDSPTEIRRILFPEEYYGKNQTGMNQMREAIFGGR